MRALFGTVVSRSLPVHAIQRYVGRVDERVDERGVEFAEEERKVRGNYTMYFQGVVDAYLWTWKVVDHRSDGWPLMTSLRPLLLLLALVALLSLLGPQLMDNRKPFAYKALPVVYCCFVCLLNAYVFLNLLVGSYRLKHTWVCDVINHDSTHEEELRVLSGVHGAMVSRVVELTDLLLAVVYKVKSQPNLFLIYHHVTMVVLCWTVARWFPGGLSATLGMLIAGAHVFTYVYVACFYVAQTYGRRFYLRGIKTLTGIAQIIQYTSIAALALHGVLTNCAYPHFMFHVILCYIPTLTLLSALTVATH